MQLRKFSCLFNNYLVIPNKEYSIIDKNEIRFPFDNNLYWKNKQPQIKTWV